MRFLSGNHGSGLGAFLRKLMPSMSLLFGGLLFSTAASAQVSYKVVPSSLSYSVSSFIGIPSVSKPITITNTGKTSFAISSFSISPSQFQLNYGYAPITLGPNQSADFAFVFLPTSNAVVTGQFTVNITGLSNPIVVDLSGTGRTSGAKAQLTPSSLNFGDVPIGVTVPQTVTLKNAGNSNLTISSISADPPFAILGGQLLTLGAGQETSFQVTYTGTAVGTYNDVVVVQYNQIQPSGIDATATGTAPSALAVSTFPTLPSATQSAAYSATLLAAGGNGNLNWNITSAQNLPSGLSLSTAGMITGTLSPTVGVGNYSFTVTVMDQSIPPQSASQQLTLPVGKPTGASCNNISWPLNNSGPPYIPITDLGSGDYLGEQGGLYPGGSNTRPPSDDSDGVAIADGIVPLDSNGNYDPNGKYGLLSLGNSVTFNDFAQFMIDVQADPQTSPYLILVPGAQPKAGAKDLAVTSSPFWSSILNFFIPQSGLTSNQIVAAWIMDVVANPTGSFPSDMTQLQSDIEAIAQNTHNLFPNLKLLYITSRYYGGYSYGVRDPADVEPYAYQSAWAMKWAIQDQLNGDPNLNYNPLLGPVTAPWMSWADYDWANGLIPRSDGLVWTCQDLQSDGTHPSNPAGREKDANLLINFFKTDDTTTPWFLAPPAK